MIEIQNLQKFFGKLNILKDINLTINVGEIFGIMGKSGAGKSTLLRCINGLETYSGGNLKVNDIEVKDLSKNGMQQFRKDVSMIFQHFALLSRKNVYDNIAFPMKCWKYDSKKIDDRVKELADIVGMSDKLKQKSSTLSGGEKQRVAIARALSMEPKVLLCDEATSALDPVTTKSILQLLREINEKLGISIIVVTHQMEVIYEVCHNVALLENGHIVLSGKVEDVFLDSSKEIQNFLGEEKINENIEGVNLQIMLLDGDDSKKIIAQLARDLQLDFSILGAKLEKYRDKHLGYITINIKEEDLEQVEEYLSVNGIRWSSY